MTQPVGGGTCFERHSSRAQAVMFSFLVALLTLPALGAEPDWHCGNSRILFDWSECRRWDPVCDHRPIIKNDDGCSTPVSENLVPYAAFFTAACREHDVCYAAPGSERGTCDDEFLGNMNYLCSNFHPQDMLCRTAAVAFYEVVNFAPSSIFKGSHKTGRKDCSLAGYDSAYSYQNLLYVLHRNRTAIYNWSSEKLHSRMEPRSTSGWGIPDDILPIDAAIYWDSRYQYFFRGDQVFRWDNTMVRMSEGYPKKIIEEFSNWPTNVPAWTIDAAIMWDNGKAYFFFGSTYIQVDQRSKQVDPGFPKSIRSRWSDWPDWGLVEAAFRGGGSKKGKAYFFKEKSYIRYDIGKDSLDDGYPKSIPDIWPEVFKERKNWQ